MASCSETQMKKFKNYYFSMPVFKLRVDTFAVKNGYKDFIDVPKSDRDTFVEMFWDSNARMGL